MPYAQKPSDMLKELLGIFVSMFCAYYPFYNNVVERFPQ